MLVCVAVVGAAVAVLAALAYTVFKMIWCITIDLTGITLTDEDLKAGNDE